MKINDIKDIGVSLGKVFGVDAGALLDTLGTMSNLNYVSGIHKREEKISSISLSTLATFAKEYYKSANGEELSQYRINIDGESILTPVFTSDRYLDVNIDPALINMSIEKPDDSSEYHVTDKYISSYAARVARKLEILDVKIWDSPLYSLTRADLKSKVPTLAFTDFCGFIAHRLTQGLMIDELEDALVDSDGKVENILNNTDKFLYIRNRLMPTLRSIEQIGSRVCVGGVGVVFAIARGEPYNDFCVPYQVRSSVVSENRNKISPVPMAYHQPLSGNDDEANLRWTVYREIFEECYNHPEVERDPGNMVHDFYFDQEPGVAWFRDHIGGFLHEVVALGWNSISGHYDFANLIVIPHEWYHKTYWSKLRPAWESRRLSNFSTRDRTAIKKLLIDRDMVPMGIFQFAECLNRLKEIASEIAPYRVDLPDIHREF